MSVADVEAERAIRDVLLRERPGDAILGEEGLAKEGEHRPALGRRPARRHRQLPLRHSRSGACRSRARARAGVILDPVRGECFRVIQDELGDARRRRRVVASTRADLGTALVATGFGYDAAVRSAQAAQLAELLPRVRDIRRLGSAALDLAWTAAGRFDAYYERGVQPWDVAAGLMLCHTAGLQIRPLAGRGDLPDGVLVAPAGPDRRAAGARRLSSSRFWGMLHTATGWWIEEAGAPAPCPPLTAPAGGGRRRHRRRLPRHVDRVAPARARSGHPRRPARARALRSRAERAQRRLRERLLGPRRRRSPSASGPAAAIRLAEEADASIRAIGEFCRKRKVDAWFRAVPPGRDLDRRRAGRRRGARRSQGLRRARPRRRAVRAGAVAGRRRSAVRRPSAAAPSSGPRRRCSPRAWRSACARRCCGAA